MVTLAISTVTRIASVLICGDKKLSYIESIEGDLVKELPLAFMKAAAGKEMNLKSIDEIIISGGPGYYTSLRIGESFAKGLLVGDSLLKLKKIDSLEVLASMVAEEKRILTVLKARKDVYHAALFAKSSSGQFQRETENLLLSESELSKWRGLPAAGEGLNYLEKRWENRIEAVNDPDAMAMYKYIHGE
ncbi:MAG: tRNA (adenosine(37)-N6)-threonylcarbamoyltransferase complex dimerization subunit type 1 TsaB [bacterium]